MKILAAIVFGLLVASGHAALAATACPPQPPVVDASDGKDLALCVDGSAGPVNRVTLELIGQGWNAQGKPAPVTQSIPIDAAPAGEIIPDGTRYTVSVPASLRGDGSARLQAHGPGGSSEVAQPGVTFPAWPAPVPPVLAVP